MKASERSISLGEIRETTAHLYDSVARLIPVVVLVSDPEDAGNEIMHESDSNQRNDQIVLDVDHVDLRSDQLVLDVSDSLAATFRATAKLAEFVMDLAEQTNKNDQPTALALRALSVLEAAGYDTVTTPLKMQAAQPKT